MDSSDNVFILDTAVEEEEEQQQQENGGDSHEDLPQEIMDVPTYTTMFTGFLTVPEFSMETGKQIANDEPPRIIKRTCFNCLGDHNVGDCTTPLNHSSIAKNRREHMANRPQQSNIRYHEIMSNKYGHFSPGTMSEELRHALGLRNNQISETVYRMRTLGYPPGWLMEAREKTGEVVLIGGDGKAVCQPEGEDGEVSGGAKYRPEKLVEFPGFNVSLPRGFREESHMYRQPEIQEEHSLTLWREIMGRNKATPYRKRKMRPVNTGNIDASTQEEEDATADDPECSIEELGQKASRGKQRNRDESPEDGELSVDSAEPSPKKSRSTDNITIDLDDDTSQELITIEDSVATEEDDGFSAIIDTNPSPVNGEGGAKDSEEEGESRNASSSSSMMKTPVSRFTDGLEESASNSTTSGCDDSSLMDESNPGTPTNSSTPANDKNKKKKKKLQLRHNRSSKGFVLGAVLPESITPFTLLPDAEKWTVDVSDHILFDNLPDATGVWNNKMKGLIKEVRSKLNFIHGDDD